MVSGYGPQIHLESPARQEMLPCNYKEKQWFVRRR
jgi:hypothetical protein